MNLETHLIIGCLILLLIILMKGDGSMYKTYEPEGFINGINNCLYNVIIIHYNSS